MTNSLFHSEHVALSAPRMDQLGLVAVIDLAAEVTDVDVEHVAPRLTVGFVDPVHQIRAQDDLPGPDRQHLEERELLARQRQRSTGAFSGPDREVDLEI